MAAPGRALGTELWVKHENHTPVGAFKVRGGLVYFARLMEREPRVRGVISATRGDHGQSIGFAARKHGLAATIAVYCKEETRRTRDNAQRNARTASDALTRSTRSSTQSP